MYITIGFILATIFFWCMLLIPIFTEFEDYEFLEDFHEYMRNDKYYDAKYSQPFLGLVMHLMTTLFLSLFTIIAYPLTIIFGAIVLYASLKHKKNNQ